MKPDDDIEFEVVWNGSMKTPLLPDRPTKTLGIGLGEVNRKRIYNLTKPRPKQQKQQKPVMKEDESCPQEMDQPEV